MLFKAIRSINNIPKMSMDSLKSFMMMISYSCQLPTIIVIINNIVIQFLSIDMEAHFILTIFIGVLTQYFHKKFRFDTHMN